LLLSGVCNRPAMLTVLGYCHCLSGSYG
jgi:hypothetical protein